MPEQKQTVIHLEHCCITCAAHRRAHELTCSILESNKNSEIDQLNQELELLTRFAQKTDFNCLMTDQPELNGSRCVDVRITELPSGEFRVSLPSTSEESHKESRWQIMQDKVAVAIWTWIGKLTH